MHSSMRSFIVTSCLRVYVWFAGADVNHVESEGWSALHFAAQNGHTDTCDLLLKNKCSLGENDEGL